MSLINNPWVGYVNRSYQSIKNALLSKVTTSNPELTDHSESNIFVIIIGMFSGIAEMLNYYIDSAAREGFITQAQRRSSVIKSSYTLDYRIKARSAESVDVIFAFKDDAEDPINLVSPLSIPNGTSITASTGQVFRTITDVTLAAGQSTYTVPFHQLEQNSNILLGSTNGAANQRLSLPTDYAHNTVNLEVNSIPFERVETWANSEYFSKHFIVEVEPDNGIKVELGDGIRGEIPVASLEVRADFYTTDGPAARVEPNTLITAPSLTLPSGVNLTVYNPLPSTGGALIESTDSIRKNAIYNRRSNLRMVTKLDYESMLSAVPGVAIAYVHFCCGRTIDIYVAPIGGGLASSGLLSSVAQEAEDKKMVGTTLRYYSAGETFIFLKLKVVAKKNRILSETKADVENALVLWGLETNQNINGSVRTSAIANVVTNLEKVESMDITEIYTIPYAKPITSVTIPLDWDVTGKPTSTIESDWRLEYNAGNIKVIKNRKFVATIAVAEEFEDEDVVFTINAGAYATGHKWTFRTYPANTNIFLTDYTIPRISVEHLDVTVNKVDDRVLPC